MFIQIGTIVNKSLEFKEKKDEDDKLDLSIENLNLSVRAQNCLQRRGISRVIDIVDLGPKKLSYIRNMGEKTYNEIISMMEDLGYVVIANDYGDSEFSYSSIDSYDEPQLDLFKQWEISKKDLEIRFDKSRERVLIAERRVAEYKSAYQFYLEKEDIFNPNAIVSTIRRAEDVKKQDIESSTHHNTKSEEQQNSNIDIQQKRREILLRSIREKQDELATLYAKLAELDGNTYDEEVRQ